MSHPTSEEWMSYLYGESSSDERINLSAHLHACPDCKARVNEWRGARENLNAWELPARRTTPVPNRQAPVLFLPLFKWAAAAGILLGLGIGIGRLTSNGSDVEKMRAAIEPEIRQQLRQEITQLLRDELNRSAPDLLAASGEQTKELLANFATALDTSLSEESQAIYAALDKLDSQRVTDYVSLKKDLDTVAVNTDVGLRHTEQQLVQLADYTQPVSFPNSPQN